MARERCRREVPRDHRRNVGRPLQRCPGNGHDIAPAEYGPELSDISQVDSRHFRRSELRLGRDSAGRGWSADLRFSSWFGTSPPELMILEGCITTRYLADDAGRAIDVVTAVSDGLGILHPDTFQLTIGYDEDDNPVDGLEALSTARSEASLRGWLGPDAFVGHQAQQLTAPDGVFPSHLAVAALVLDYDKSTLEAGEWSYGWRVRASVISRPYAAPDAVDVDLRTLLHRAEPGAAVSALLDALRILKLPLAEGASLLVEHDGSDPKYPLPPGWRALVRREAARCGLQSYPY